MRTFGRSLSKLPKSGFDPGFLDVLERSGRTGFWHIDLLSDEVFFSKVVCETHGMPPGYIPQGINECLEWYHPDDRELVSKTVRGAAEEGKPFSYEARLVTSGNSSCWVSVDGEIGIDKAGRPFKIFGTMQDISDSRDMTSRLNDALRDAQSASRLKESFLANMSHELRTPLNAIIGFSQLIKMMETSGRVDQQVAGYASDIADAGGHLLTIVEDIFRVAQLEADTSDVSREPVVIGTLLDDVRSLTGAAAREQGRQLDLECTLCARTSIIGDKDKLAKVLVNFVSNALKFSPVSSPVKIVAECEGDSRVLIRVTDEGPGIPAALHQKIFERFERLEASKYAIEGIGVGLAIARDLVTSMGGEIGVDSVEGEGSTFWLSFPVEQRAKLTLVE